MELSDDENDLEINKNNEKKDSSDINKKNDKKNYNREIVRKHYESNNVLNEFKKIWI